MNIGYKGNLLGGEKKSFKGENGVVVTEQGSEVTVALDETVTGGAEEVKERVDQLENDVAAVETKVDQKVNRNGDTMTGELQVPAGTTAGAAVNLGQLQAVETKTDNVATEMEQVKDDIADLQSKEPEIATAEKAGIVKVGTGLKILEDGTLSVPAGSGLVVDPTTGEINVVLGTGLKLVDGAVEVDSAMYVKKNGDTMTGTLSAARAFGTYPITEIGTQNGVEVKNTGGSVVYGTDGTGGKMSATGGYFDVGGAKIIGLAEPTVDAGAATKKYADKMLPKSGGTMTGFLGMPTAPGSIVNPSGLGVGTPASGTPILTAYTMSGLVCPLIGFSTARHFNSYGDVIGTSMIDPVNIEGVKDPVYALDAANKKYVDSAVSGVSGLKGNFTYVAAYDIPIGGTNHAGASNIPTLPISELLCCVISYQSAAYYTGAFMLAGDAGEYYYAVPNTSDDSLYFSIGITANRIAAKDYVRTATSNISMNVQIFKLT